MTYLLKVIRELHRATEDSDDQQSRGTQLLEIYALEIQMYNETKNHKKLKVTTFLLAHDRSLTSTAGNL